MAGVRTRLVGALVLAALAAAGCGASEPTRELRPWRVEPPYLPPPEPSAAASAHASAPARARRRRAAPRPAATAPSDAQVRRELRRALGGADASELVDRATVGAAGLATVPPSAPARVAAIIVAGNQVATKPYVYGGGHGRLAGETFIDSAYDCSGSVSFALAGAGLVGAPMDSSTLARWGRPGPGRWVSIYANAGHAFMTVAGLRFDTSGRREGGSRWQAASRSVAGFTVRHPDGL
jgi:cell wall-associated NlpC family hydrolase